ncbi:MAG TPA: hypothetical protein VGK37_06510 [Casimicrobiaceae bacterium]
MAFPDEASNPPKWGGVTGYTWQSGSRTSAAPGPTWQQDMSRGAAHAHDPGCHTYDGDAGNQWLQVGGDWIDANDALHGAVPFASRMIAAVSPTAPPMQIALDATAILKKPRNYGFWLATTNSNIVRIASRFALANAPTLTVVTSKGTSVVSCSRTVGLSDSTTVTLAGGAQIKISGKSDYGMLWADVSQFDSADIISATLNLWLLSDAVYTLGNTTLQLFRVWNPGDASTLAPQKLGVAQNYPLDNGLINDPAVRFHERFDDANYTTRALYLYGPNHSLLTAYDPNMGEPMLPGMNELRVRQIATIQKIGDTGNSAENSLWQAVWSPWRPNPEFYHAKPPAPMEEAYMRYLFRPWLTWKDLGPDGGKLPGVDCRYAGYGTGFPWIPGMGAGNSGDPCTGLNGGSVRMNYGARPPASSPTANFQGIGASDCYNIDQPGNFGSSLMFSKNYLAMIRLGTLNSVELHFKMNTVSDPTAKPRLLASVTSDGSGKALATLVAPDPTLRTWPLVSTSGFASPTGTQGAFNVSGVPVTYINDSQFTYPIAPGVTYTPGHLGGPAGPCAWACVPSVANPDGIVEGFVNGRYAGGANDFRIRHSRYCLDGTTINGIDGFWFNMYEGGPKPPIGNGDVSFGSLVVSDAYIGPPVLS